MKRQIPLTVCFLAGLFFALQYFSPHPVPDFYSARLLKWTTIIGFFALGLGLISLWLTHLPKVMKQAPGWGYNAVALAGFMAMAVTGLIWGKDPGTPFIWLYNNMMNPITATMFALLAFFIASAAYRAFRIRSILATILLVAAVLVMLGRVPLGDLISFGYFGKIASWLLNYPNVAAKRAIVAGVGFGGAATALKILLGIERSYLGGDK
jgi:hypothetical protein